MYRLTKSDKALAATPVRRIIAESVCAACGAPATQMRYIDPATAAPCDSLTTVAAWLGEIAKQTPRCASH